ncbi:MAG: lipase secretion chaperone [Acidobacteriota bacterium]
MKKLLCLACASFAFAAAASAGPAAVELRASAPIPSLEGTVADGALHLDADGVLVLDADARLYFDYFMSARGEVDDRALVAHVRRDASSRLPAEAAAEAARLFARHLRFADLAAERLDGASLGDAFAILDATRREVFGGRVAARLFPDQLALERSALLLQKARVDAGTPAQQRAALERYEASLSSEELRARAAATLPLRVREQVRRLRLAGADDAAVWAVRAEAFGADAADRLRALDRRRAGR